MTAVPRDLALGAALVVAAYFLGSIPFGFLIARVRGIDIRERGSGNIGATNVTRSLGARLGLVVLACDMLKGVLPVVAARALELGPWAGAACGLAPVIGHCFPVWLRFRGGKGVATTFGVLVAADPPIALIALVTFAVIYALVRLASLGSLAAAAVVPTAMLVAGRPRALVALGVACAVLIVVKHRANIRRLLRGEELRL